MICAVSAAADVALTVTGCGVFQLLLLKLTLASTQCHLIIGTVGFDSKTFTVPFGCVFSLIVKVLLVPAATYSGAGLAVMPLPSSRRCP